MASNQQGEHEPAAGEQLASATVGAGPNRQSEPAAQPSQGKRWGALLLLLILLLPATLISVLFLVVSLVGLLLSLFDVPHSSGFEPVSLHWAMALVLVGFTLPIALVLCRASYAVLLRLVRGRKTALVTPAALLPASILLGLPGLAFSVFALLGGFGEPRPEAIHGLWGSVLILGGPLLLWRLRRPAR